MPMLLGSEYPIAEYCDLRQAYQWVADNILPRGKEHAAALGIDQRLRTDSANKTALNQIHKKMSDGSIPVSGRLKISNYCVDDNDALSGPVWGNSQPIPTERVKQSAISFEGSRLERRGLIFEYEWQYSEVRILTKTLFQVFPAGNEQPNIQPDANASPIYTTTLLEVVDALRPKIALSPLTWTRDAIEAECKGMSPSLSKREVEAIGYVLLPDKVRRR